MARYSSPLPSTNTPVDTVMANHSIALNGSVRNILPPKVTMIHWPAKIIKSTSNTKIHHLDIAAICDHDVGRLDIAVHDIALM